MLATFNGAGGAVVGGSDLLATDAWFAELDGWSPDMAGQRMSNELRYRDGEHPSQTWFTPSYVLNPVRADLGGTIGLDPCTTADNPVGADAYYTVAEDGLLRSWWGPDLTVFVNPPYSKAREPWVERCISAGARGQKVVLLIPSATDTRIWQKAASTATAIVFVKGRVKFGALRPNRRQVAATHPSSLLGWNTDLAACSVLGFTTSFPELRRVAA